MYALVFAALLGAIALSSARADDSHFSVALEPSAPSPAPVGTMISWTAKVSGNTSDQLWYRFRIRRPNEGFRTVRDFGPSSSLDWTSSEHEGRLDIEVAVRGPGGENTAAASASFDFTSRVTGERPVVNPTSHPLVWLYSAPPCPAGSRMTVYIRSPEGATQSTNEKPCEQGLSMNFYLSGMRPRTMYALEHRTDGESGPQESDEFEFDTGGTDLESWAESEADDAPATEGILLHSPLNDTATATDLAGNIVWFHRGYVSKLTRPVPGGSFVGIVDESRDLSQQVVREFDLVGMNLRETNAARVNEQLAVLGRRQISGFHHEAARLPDGRLLVLATVEQILEDVQGPGPVDVLGDMIIILDQDLQVEWVWDAFDHMDARRAAVLGEVCTGATGGCPPFFLAARANDWLHGNSVQLAPDGNLVFSIRHQDWIVKIDYDHGRGTGRVIWRLGKDGDFRIESDDPYPWFSHQHDAGFAFDDDRILVLFDNGNTRRASIPESNSRGQALQLDEENLVARLVLNADLGAYSSALGSAQKLANGNYQFDLGFLPDRTSASVEVDAEGKVVSTFRNSVPEYRIFRMPSLYQVY